MRNKFRTLGLVVCMGLLFSACENNANPIGDTVPIIGGADSNASNSLIIEPGNLSIEVGKSSQLTAILSQSGQLSRDLPATWSSQNADIASVDANGNITGLKPGTATIKAVILGAESQALITVTAASASLSPATSSTSTTPSSSSTSSSGVGTASENSETSPELAKLRTIEIKPINQVVPPVTVRLSSLNEQRQFEAVGKDAEGQEISKLTFTWTSSKEDVATINSTGVVTAVATGVTNLIATAGNVQSNTIVIEVQSGIVNAQIKFTE